MPSALSLLFRHPREQVCELRPIDAQRRSCSRSRTAHRSAAPRRAPAERKAPGRRTTAANPAAPGTRRCGLMPESRPCLRKDGKNATQRLGLEAVGYAHREALEPKLDRGVSLTATFRLAELDELEGHRPAAPSRLDLPTLLPAPAHQRIRVHSRLCSISTGRQPALFPRLYVTLSFRVRRLGHRHRREFYAPPAPVSATRFVRRIPT